MDVCARYRTTPHDISNKELEAIGAINVAAINRAAQANRATFAGEVRLRPPPGRGYLQGDELAAVSQAAAQRHMAPAARAAGATFAAQYSDNHIAACRIERIP